MSAERLLNFPAATSTVVTLALIDFPEASHQTGFRPVRRLIAIPNTRKAIPRDGVETPLGWGFRRSPARPQTSRLTTNQLTITAIMKLNL